MRNAALKLIPHIVLLCLISHSRACMFIVTNNCPHTIWPGTLAGAGTPQLATTGFQLESGHSVSIRTPPGWSGRIWARTGCAFDENGAGTCETGDCDGKIACNGMGASPPATLFEITLGQGQDKDYYDVSLVDGYNLPLVAGPSSMGCNITGCVANLNSGCPKELQVVDGGAGSAGGVIACKSACKEFGLDEYCCSGAFGSPETCRPSFYSTIFKTACPKAYSYAYDDGSSTFTCKASDYTLTFCPTINGLQKSNGIATPAQPTGGSRTGKAREVTSSSNSLSLNMSFIFLLILYM